MDNKEFVLINCFTLNDLCLNIIEKLDEEYRSEAFAEFTFDTLVNYSTLPEYEIRNWINYFGVIKLSNNDISDFGPQRFREDVVFETIRLKYLSHWENIEWISEVTMGVGGNIDYVAVTRNVDGY